MGGLKGSKGVKRAAGVESSVEELIEGQIAQMGLKCGPIEVIRLKDGVWVCRVICCGVSYVLKYFHEKEDRREIANYRVLRNLDIPTLRIIAHTDSALLIEDVERSDEFRLGLKTDMEDPLVAARLAE